MWFLLKKELVKNLVSKIKFGLNKNCYKKIQSKKVHPKILLFTTKKQTHASHRSVHSAGWQVDKKVGNKMQVTSQTFDWCNLQPTCINHIIIIYKILKHKLKISFEFIFSSYFYKIFYNIFQSCLFFICFFLVFFNIFP